MMMKTFLLGALGYPLLEILWRGRSHYSMALAGGIACVRIKKRAQKKGSLLYKAFLCALDITAVEYMTGLVFNRRHHVWDYRRSPGHIAGQICPLYTFLWFLLSACLLNFPPIRSCAKKTNML